MDSPTAFAQYANLLASLHIKYAADIRRRLSEGQPKKRRSLGYSRLTTEQKLDMVEAWKKSGMSQEAFAKAQGVSYSAFNKWARGLGLVKLWRDE